MCNKTLNRCKICIKIDPTIDQVSSLEARLQRCLENTFSHQKVHFCGNCDVKIVHLYFSFYDIF